MSESKPVIRVAGSPPVRYAPALLLFFLPAVSVELLSGNMPLSQYLFPFIFVTLNIIYGGAAVLIRETVARWNKGIASIILLGAAYGMVNEGLTSKGFFDPHFYSVIEFGLENVGRFFGINVAWALSITVFHALCSITVPILLVDALFPGKGRWLGNKNFLFLLAIFVAVVVFAYAHVNIANNPAPGTLALVLALMLLCGVAAKTIPDIRAAKFAKPPGKAALFGFGALYAFAVVFACWGVYRLFPFLAVHVGVLAGLVLLFIWFMLKLPQTTGRSQVALVTGMLAPMIFTASTHGLLVPLMMIVAVLAVSWMKSKDRPIKEAGG